MWQLMPSTARGLGLQVSALVDERQHPERSTAAALDYLGTLRGEFDSWFLTLAAYNSGPTRVRGILRRYAPDEPHSDSLFWALRDRFPLETREFVPKLYGAMWVASRPEAYGYGLAPTGAPSADN
jgi:membrane-bound lytic murein transglycosylase D